MTDREQPYGANHPLLESLAALGPESANYQMVKIDSQQIDKAPGRGRKGHRRSRWSHFATANPIIGDDFGHRSWSHDHDHARGMELQLVESSPGLGAPPSGRPLINNQYGDSTKSTGKLILH